MSQIGCACVLSDFLVLETLCFPVDQRWGVGAWEAELDQPDRLVLTHGAPKLGAAASFRVAGDDVELLRIMVAPPLRRTGIARALLADGMAWASERAAQRLLLEVRADNDPARQLYTSCGFTPLSVRANYYGPGVDAVVMAASLGSGEVSR